MGLKPPWWIHMGEPSNDTVGFSQLNLQSYPFPTMKHTPIGDARMNRSSSTQGLFGCEIWFLFRCICIIYIYICIDTNFFQQNICVFYYFWDSRKQTPKKGRDQQWFEQGSSHGRSQRYVALCHWLGPKLVTTYKQLATWWLGHGGWTISISPGIVALKWQGLMGR